ncbi:glycosyltransferase family 2 protein [Flavisolibacter sp. BT320]|nr:glycosyltransferase family 2 protein [Flavisolibacter longurius]
MQTEKAGSQGRKPIFSVLVANYNNGTFFKDCYQSLCNQTYKDFEVVIVDDCSTDDSVQLIQDTIKGDARCRLFLNDQNRGCGFTKSRCVELALGTICGFVDPDDAIRADAIQTLVMAHEANPDVALVYSTFTFCNKDLQPLEVYATAGPVTVTPSFTNLDGKVNHFATFKRSFYNKTSGIDTGLRRAVDQDLYLKLSETGKFHFVNQALYNYRIHDSGIATANVDKAFYWFLKVIAKAEERRNINLESEVGVFLNRTNPKNLTQNLSNPRYLLVKLRDAFKAKPTRFIKRLLVG